MSNLSILTGLRTRLRTGSLVAAVAAVGAVGGLGACDADDAQGDLSDGVMGRAGRVAGRLTAAGASSAADAADHGADGAGHEAGASAATRVVVGVVEDDGALFVLGSAAVVDGGYGVTVPEHPGPLLIQARGADDVVVGEALLERGPEVGDIVYAQPMSAESAFEASVFVRLRQTDHDGAEIDPVLLRTRIDAAVVEAAIDANDDTSDAADDETAVAVVAAALGGQNAVWRHEYAERGIRFDDVVAAGAAAIARRDEARYARTAVAAAGANVEGDVDVDVGVDGGLAQDLVDISDAYGFSAVERGQIESQASAAARVAVATLGARAVPGVDERLALALWKGIALREATAVGDGIVSVVNVNSGSGNDGSGNVDAADAQGRALGLEAALERARTRVELDAAWDAFRRDVRGDGTIDVWLLSLAGTDLADAVGLEAALRAVIASGEALAVQVDAAGAAALADGAREGELDDETLASAVDDAYDAFRRSLAASLQPLGDDGDVVGRVLGLSEGAWR